MNWTCVPDVAALGPIIPLHVSLELKWQAVLIVLRNILIVSVLSHG